jgi:hypothetical protein
MLASGLTVGGEQKNSACADALDTSASVVTDGFSIPHSHTTRLFQGSIRRSDRVRRLL